MNRRILLQVAAPSVAVGLLLLAACGASVWYIHHIQHEFARLLSQNVTLLQAAQVLEIRVRQLRFHSFLYLVEPRADRMAPVETDQRLFEEALATARATAVTAEERASVGAIEAGYREYRRELAKLREEVARAGPRTDFGRLADAHPIRHVVDPCQDLLRLSQQAMEQSSRESARVSERVQLAMAALGVLGPLSGLVLGYGIARGLSRSIYKLSLRVQNMAQHLDQDVASVVVSADGDLQSLDRQLRHIVAKVEEVGERLQRHQRDMLRAEQLAAVGQLAASVAHEVRNPLAAVKLLVDAARRVQNRKPLSTEDLEVIQRELGRLEQTVQHFLDFARPPAPQRSRTDLREVIGQAVDLVRARLNQQAVSLDTRLPHRPLWANIDRNQLGTVLVNLFINALDAMPKGGRLEVRLEDDPALGVRLQVADTGPGIPPAMAGRLFTPFASSKPTGTGLGLSISRRIIEEHDGAISAANEPQGGACFTIRLPRLLPEDVHAHAAGR
jgi:signal transduction histidine kinase